MSEPRLNYVDDVGGVFTQYATPDGRECVGGDLGAAGAEEMVRQFTQAEEILEGLMRSAEYINLGLYLCVGEAKWRAKMARKAAERYAP